MQHATPIPDLPPQMMAPAPDVPIQRIGTALGSEPAVEDLMTEARAVVE